METVLAIDLNSFVYLKLTSFGKKILQDERAALEYTLAGKQAIIASLPPALPEEDENGYSRWPLWKVFNSFGVYLNIGADELPFLQLIQVILPETTIHLEEK